MKRTKIKRVFLLILSLLIIISSLPVVSASATIYTDVSGLEYTIADGEVTVSGCSKDVKDLVLSSSINGYPVTRIVEYAFRDHTNLNSITIPDSIKEIGINAFYNCTKLKNVYVSSIESWCTIDFLGGSYCNPLYYADYLYVDGEQIVDIKIPEGVETIRQHAFKGYRNLQSISIPNTVTSIEKSAFKGCTSLDSITIPDNVESIGSWAFQSCTALNNIKLPRRLVSIGSYAFYDTAYYNNESNWKYGALYVDSCLVEVRADHNYCFVKSDTTLIAQQAFMEKDGARPKTYQIYYWGDEESWQKISICSNNSFYSNIRYMESDYPIGLLSSINKGEVTITGYIGNESSLVIPADCNGYPVTSIDYDAFQGCTSIQSITIPDSVKDVSSGAFYGCTNLKNVCVSSIESWCNIDFGGYSGNPLAYADYLYVDGEKVTDLIVPESVKNILPHTFCGYANLRSVTFHDNLESIGYGAFSDCTGIKNIDIPNSVTIINESVFSDCLSLENIIIPEGLTHIGSSAFSSCTSLQNIDIPNSVTIIDERAFSNCLSLESIIIPDGLTHIGSGAFYECTGLCDITLPDSIESIGEDSFYNTAYYNDDDNWQSGILYIDTYLIDARPFSDGCFIREGTRLIADSVFPYNSYMDYDIYYYGAEESWNNIIIGNNNKGLESAEIIFPSPDCPFGLEYIIRNNEVIIYRYRRGAASELVIPSTIEGCPVTTIDTYAFYDCKNLQSITIPNNVTSIGYDAFGSCINLAEVYYHGSPAMWNEIDISSYNNNYLLSAKRVYFIDNCNIMFNEPFYTYKGNKIVPEFTVKYGDDILVNGIDYTVSCLDNIYPGTATVIVTGIGKYTGSASTTFEIKAFPVTSCTVTLDKASYVYDGTSKKPAVTVKYGTKSLVNGTDYTVSYSENINAGTATVSVKGKGNYTGSISQTFTIAEYSIVNCSTSLDADSFVYDGTEKKPTVTIKHGAKTLVNNTDYTLTYSHNTNAGTATVVISGKGNYTGSLNKVFTISKKPVKSLSVTLDNTAFFYDGVAKKPVATVKDGTKILVEGTDYNVSYSNNINMGTATFTVTGKGNYTGTVDTKFNIVKNIATDCTVTLEKTVCIYDGKDQTPKVTVKDGIKVLSEGKDYAVVYFDNRYLGTATAQVVGLGDYAGMVIKEFTIAVSIEKNCTIALDKTIYTYDGKEKKPQVTVKFDTITLTEGTDYIVSYTNNVKVGTAGVTVTGKGKYTGSNSVAFSIVMPSSAEFEWGRDNWNFDNSAPGYFNYSTYRQQISQSYLNILSNNLTNSEYQEIFRGYWNRNAWLDDFWGGSCYGMSSLALLAKKGYLTFSDYKSGATELNDLNSPKNDFKLSSLITYYQMLQIKDIIQQQYRTVPYQSHKDNITKIISLLDRNSTVLIGFRKNGWGGHATLAYGYEYGSWRHDGVTYDGCIKICDPNASVSYDSSFNIYFNSQTYSWTIPAYSYVPIASSSGAVFNFMSADVNCINKGGYLSGISEDNPYDFVARIDAFAIDEARSVAKVVERDGSYMNQSTAPGEIIEDYYYIFCGESEGRTGYILHDADASYRITQESPVKMQLAMDYENFNLTGGSAAGTEIIFDKDGSVTVYGEAADYNLSITSDVDYPTTWFTIEVIGEGADKASLRMTDEGYILTADNLSNVVVDANNKEVGVTTSFSTEYGSVFIYEIDENTIGVRVDTDNNGTYETDLTDADITAKLGDANGDGKVNVKDATQIQKAVAGLLTLDEAGESAADADGSGKVNVKDATAIQKWVAGIETGFLIGEPVKKQ